MELQIRVKTGSAEGKLFDVEAGAVIGRANSTIILPDPKVSGRHAKFEKDRSGNWVLTDLGSTNGIRVRNKRVMQVSITPGLVFRIGNTELEVIQKAVAAKSAPAVEVAEASSPSMSDVTLPPVPVQVPTSPIDQTVARKQESSTVEPVRPESVEIIAPPQVVPKKSVALDWDEYLGRFAKRAREKVQNKPKLLYPFSPLLILTVVRGIQVGTQWVLGYGPRDVGPDALEFHLFDPNAPALAFRVTPRGTFAFYETEHPRQVKLNGSALSSETLREGDEIRISDTIIKVSYKE